MITYLLKYKNFPYTGIFI